MTQVVKHLGLGGLYRGYFITLMRDVPFSMIFFPLYAFLKDVGKISLLCVCVCNAVALTQSSSLVLRCSLMTMATRISPGVLLRELLLVPSPRVL